MANGNERRGAKRITVRVEALPADFVARDARVQKIYGSLGFSPEWVAQQRANVDSILEAIRNGTLIPVPNVRDTKH
ncbi:MAG: hypothetical protein WC880_00955 [Candidatus Paceibacterota bacterium]